jgi:hypothetical protein
MIVEQSATVSAMRKYEIISQIYYYLNIQQKFLDADAARVGERSLTRDKKTKFTSSMSGLSESQKKRIQEELLKLISKINISDATSLNSNIVPEAKLLKLLRSAAGSQRENYSYFIDYINSRYPNKTKEEAESKMILKLVSLFIQT